MEHKKGSSGVAKAGMVTGITALGIKALDGTLGGFFGGNGIPFAGGYGGGGYLTILASENAQLKAEKYTDCTVASLVTEAITPLANRICELEKEAAVNKEADKWYRRYAEAKYLSKPDTFLHDRFIVTHEEHCGKHHGHHGDSAEG